ncbi:hypothetical protein [Sphingomonas jatrophae]|uniref:Uncharacterized protein n=1 Tax=Sphingomonas jatrophae TaxID=1166337 RepID=A0A1I6L0K4_9SPHN|nr:hypothetical protein [Sphingomonas jatrophae]SFR97009.1 hypothetical protein SAMN05192580_2107 [Sphingomonas jatrophae]
MAKEIPWQAHSRLVQAWSGRMLAQGSLTEVIGYYRALPYRERHAIDCLKCAEPVPVAGRMMRQLGRLEVEELKDLVTAHA